MTRAENGESPSRLSAESAPSASCDGYLLLAKREGVTSFDSLALVKRALGTRRVGHTGTLDSFADGLLVVLCGRLTRLTPYITSLSKTYLCVVCFGLETDTLDPTGRVVREGRAPERREIESVLPAFEGDILQTPPLYSAVHVAGRRASAIARSGGGADLKARRVRINSTKLLDFRKELRGAEGEGGLSFALFEVDCSKGTYIRSLARDIAEAAGTCATCAALRRTKVGPFRLSDAAFCEALPQFTIERGEEAVRALLSRGAHAANPKAPPGAARAPFPETTLHETRARFSLFSPDVAAACGLKCVTVPDARKSDFSHGSRVAPAMFSPAPESAGDYAAFYENGDVAGVVNFDGRTVRLRFVCPPRGAFGVFSWDDVVSGRIPPALRARGTALSVGSFETVHRGHLAIMARLRSQKTLFHGVVTFRSPIKGDAPLFSLQQRLDAMGELDFAVVIDFTSDFSRMSGEDFVRTLVDELGMRFMAEGADFRAGYKGACGMEELAHLAEKYGFTLCEVPAELCGGRKISSSWVRECLRDGNTALADTLLGRPSAWR